MGQRTNSVSFSCSLEPNSWANRLLIQVIAQSLAIDAEGFAISALTAEKSGRDWYLWIQLVGKDRSKSLRLPASDILINGKSLGHFLEATVTKGT